MTFHPCLIALTVCLLCDAGEWDCSENCDYCDGPGFRGQPPSGTISARHRRRNQTLAQLNSELGFDRRGFMLGGGITLMKSALCAERLLSIQFFILSGMAAI